MGASDDEEAPVEDANGRGIPALDHEREVGGILEDGTTLARRRRTRLEDANGLVSRLDTRITVVPLLVPTHADLLISGDRRIR